ncbi:hypothetical protein ACJX0J_030804, partial [Zea mays]
MLLDWTTTLIKAMEEAGNDRAYAMIAHKRMSIWSIFGFTIILTHTILSFMIEEKIHDFIDKICAAAATKEAAVLHALVFYIPKKYGRLETAIIYRL